MVFGFSFVGFSVLFCFFVFVFYLNLQYETKSNPKLTTPFLASLKSSMVFGNVFSSLKIACVHKTGKTPKLNQKTPTTSPSPAPRSQGGRWVSHRPGATAAHICSETCSGNSGVLRRVISIQRRVSEGTSWVRHFHPAMVVNCIQEQ